MTDLERWQRNNEAYLSAAMELVRIRLERLAPMPVPVMAEEHRATPRTADQPPPTSGNWWKFRRHPGTLAADFRIAPKALKAASTTILPEQLAAAAENVRLAEALEPAPAMMLLSKRLGLTPFERNVLLLCIAMELDTSTAFLAARAHDDPSRPYPTFALALVAFDDAVWDAISPERPLLYWRLLEIAQGAGQPLTTSPLRADQRIVNYVKGLGHLDERIAPFLSPIASTGTDPAALPESQQAVVDAILSTLQRDSGRFAPIQLLGTDSESKQLAGQAVAHALDVSLYRLAAEMLPAHPADLETFARLWQRETALLPLGLWIDAHDLDRQSEAHATPLKRFLGRTGGILFVDAREPWPVAAGTHLFDIEKPTPTEQRQLWIDALGEANDGTAARLAGQFNLSAATIGHLGGAAGGDPATDGDRLWDAAAASSRMRIDALAQRIEAKATWDDLVLPAEETNLLQQISAHAGGRSVVYDDWGFRARTNRGLCISALFAGESGTGKTMAAEVIANELRLSLHRIDLSAVVSKWVGETEKNIQRVFQAAEDGGGMLFFDEADALFGKRTEVQQSQDRFANIEINFLLQRMESYRGLVILATNMKNALDHAFLRRLRFIVNFPFPGIAERKAIWERVFPPEAPREGLDFDRLARLNLTGGSVHNVALTSAFLAARRGSKITMPIVLEAARTELRKLDKPVNEADFRWREIGSGLTAV